MNKKEKALPFGLLFEEAAPLPQGLVSPVYDEDTDLSYVKDADGSRVPYVEFCGILGTQTVTEVKDEETDEDEEEERFNQLMGTDTATKADGENTDEDPDDDDTSTKSMNDVTYAHWAD